MSILKGSHITIYEALKHIKMRKNVTPAFQQQYVWKMEIVRIEGDLESDFPIPSFSRTNK